MDALAALCANTLEQDVEDMFDRDDEEPEADIHQPGGGGNVRSMYEALGISAKQPEPGSRPERARGSRPEQPPAAPLKVCFGCKRCATSPNVKWAYPTYDGDWCSDCDNKHKLHLAKIVGDKAELRTWLQASPVNQARFDKLGALREHDQAAEAPAESSQAHWKTEEKSHNKQTRKHARSKKHRKPKKAISSQQPYKLQQKQANALKCQQASKQASKQANTQALQQASKQASQASKQAPIKQASQTTTFVCDHFLFILYFCTIYIHTYNNYKLQSLAPLRCVWKVETWKPKRRKLNHTHLKALHFTWQWQASKCRVLRVER
jgi:hypothetical protein